MDIRVSALTNDNIQEADVVETYFFEDVSFDEMRQSVLYFMTDLESKHPECYIVAELIR